MKGVDISRTNSLLCWLREFQPQLSNSRWNLWSPLQTRIKDSKQTVETLWFFIAKKLKQAESVGKVKTSVFVFFFWRGGSEGVNIIDYLKKAHTIKVQYYASINKTTEQSNEVETQRETEGRCSLSTWWRVRLDCPGCSSYSSSMRHWIATHSRLLIDLAPSDTVFFSKLKAHLLGRNFENNDQIICAVEELLEDKGATFICDGMAIPHHRLKKCVDVKGEYIEI